jgi:phosphoribosylanthranilate isomerase
VAIIKICGITNKPDALEASRLGADMLGFVFYKKSKRAVDAKTVRDIANELDEKTVKVGVFVDEDAGKVADIAEDCALDVLQFHGEETPEYCARLRGRYKTIKAFRVKDRVSLKKIAGYDTDYYMLDTYSASSRGGTGKSFDWKIIEGFEFLKPLILSGGLTPDNVAGAIKAVAPYGVDVSSGVEALPGKKDTELMKRFVENVRKMS